MFSPSFFILICFRLYSFVMHLDFAKRSLNLAALLALTFSTSLPNIVRTVTIAWMHRRYLALIAPWLSMVSGDREPYSWLAINFGPCTFSNLLSDTLLIPACLPCLDWCIAKSYWECLEDPICQNHIFHNHPLFMSNSIYHPNP